MSQESVMPVRLDSLTSVAASRSWRSLSAVLLAVLGPLLAIATYVVFSNFRGQDGFDALRSILLVDLIYVLILAGLLAYRVIIAISDRRAESAGSRLHLRLTGVFTLMALAPTIIVAIFATITINVGLESWFSDRVQTVLSNSLAAARAYEQEHRQNLMADGQLLADFLNDGKRNFPLISASQTREMLTEGQALMQREISEAYIVDGAGEIRSRGRLSYLFDFEAPSQAQLDRALSGEAVVIEDWVQNEFRALIHLSGFVDRYLYISRKVDGNILELLDETQSTVELYQQLEGSRGRLLFEFALIYLGFSLIIILAAVWLGFWFAERISRPIGQLAGAAQQIGSGDLSARVAEAPGDDEIALLARTFNRMSHRVKQQHDALVVANAEVDRRRRRFEAVLSGVSAGVIGLDADGNIEVMNDAADRILRGQSRELIGKHIATASPQFSALFEAFKQGKSSSFQDRIHLTLDGAEEDLMIRFARHGLGHGGYGYVLTFDSVTDLVQAQRMAAWGDVARRVAHEIKNPLTPIQLAAERMRRKFGPQISENREGFDQYTDMIVRQTNDLRHLVDEFSKFARMRDPQLEAVRVDELLRDVTLLQREAQIGVAFDVNIPEQPVKMMLDPSMMRQAFTNLLKNAGEAIADRKRRGDAFKPMIGVSLSITDTCVEVMISDNGIGLPDGSQRLFEPYVTHREDGTGLGLPIVKKIIEQHRGDIALTRASDDPDMFGAKATIRLPNAPLPQEENMDS